MLQNQTGIINEQTISIPHGSVYSMSHKSQANWKHSFPADPSKTTPRISFTFRQLIPDSQVVKPPRAPPICHPDEYVSTHSPQQGTHEGILLLTDSIIGQTPEHIFDRIPGHRLIKKTNKQLTNFMNFEPEFKYRKAVILSCGVNDLSCYGLRGRALGNIICPRLAETANKHPDTTFVFNSIIYTRHTWLNKEIDTFNQLIFEMSLTMPNFLFFDSSSVISRDPISHSWDNVIEPRDPRRIHLTRNARILITDHLVNGIELLCRRKDGKPLPPSIRNWVWPMRREYLESLPEIRASLGHRSVTHNLTCGT